ncbi:MAG: hypothetical protein ACO3LE_09125 [Bdellovibrionota bacterium]
MRFRLLSCVLKIAFIVVNFTIFFNVSLFANSPRSYVGMLPALEGVNVKSFDLRSDARYLFYSTGSSSWNVVDLLDMTTLGPQNFNAGSNVVALFYRSSNELVVVSAKRIDLYDVTKVFKPELKSTSYTFPSANSPLDACVGENGQIFVLEFDSLGNFFVRVLSSNLNVLKTISWSTIFENSGRPSEDLFPIAIRCFKAGAILVAEEERPSDASDFWLGLIQDDLSVLSPVVVRQAAYSLQDLIVDNYSQRVLTLFNREISQAKSSDSILKVFNFDSEAVEPFPSLFNVGSEGKALSAFLENSKPFYSAFVGQDYLSSSVSPPQNQVLQFEAANSVSSLNLLPDRGVEDAVFGLGPIFSQWRSSNSDHYAYGLFSSQGVGLLSDSPKFEIVEIENLKLSASKDLEFTVRSDRDVDLKIRVIDDIKTEGEASGININRGSLISSSSLNENENFEVRISAEQVKTTKELNLRLLLLATEKNNSEASIARVGLPFSIDKEPPAVQNLRLGFGDRSLRVFFDLPYDPGDIDYFLIFMAKSEVELETLPTSVEDLNETWNDLRFEGHGEASFSNPIKISQSDWQGSYEIAPLKNDEDVFIRVLVVDQSSNFSLENPASISNRPRPTLSLQKAFGSQGCSLQAVTNNSGGTFASFIFFVLSLMIFRRLKKNWAQR